MADRQDLKLLDAYKAAKAAGTGDQFIQTHPKFAAQLSATSPKAAAAVAVAQGKAKAANPLAAVKKLGKKEKKQVAADIAVEDIQTQKNISNQNPTTQNDFVSSTVTYDEDGNPVYTEEIAEDQKDMLDASQNLNKVGTAKATDIAEGYDGFTPSDKTDLGSFDYGSSEEERARIEEAVFGRLTKNLDRDMGRELQTKEQELYNKGIPYSDDPESRYQKEIRGIQDRYDSAKADAMGQAVEMGGGELSRNYNIESGTFGINQNTAAQNYAQELTTSNKALSDVGTLSGFGQGAILQSGPGYNAPNQVDLNAPSELDIANKQAQSGRISANAAKTNAQTSKNAAEAAAALAGEGGGGGGEPPKYTGGLPKP